PEYSHPRSGAAVEEMPATVFPPLEMIDDKIMRSGVNSMILLAHRHSVRRAFWLFVAVAALASAPLRAEEAKISYDRDIRPILSDNCFACHGPDAKQRKAKLRLDIPEGAFAKLRSGERAIVPGKTDDSVLVERITDDNPSRRMPPKKSGK